MVAITSALKKLADDMLEAMYKSNGIGLAAPQVGESIRLIVVDLAENEKRKPIILFNPVITATRGESLGEEGCLSLPGIWADVTRPDIITVKALDREAIPFEFKDIGGMLSRCIQHEIDHLEGVLFVDKISATDRIFNDAKLKKLAREAR